MSLKKALKYAIWRKKFEILRKLGVPAECNHDKSEQSDNNDDFENDIYRFKNLQILHPPTFAGESEISDSDDSMY